MCQLRIPSRSTGISDSEADDIKIINLAERSGAGRGERGREGGRDVEDALATSQEAFTSVWIYLKLHGKLHHFFLFLKNPCDAHEVNVANGHRGRE